MDVITLLNDNHSSLHTAFQDLSCDMRRRPGTKGNIRLLQGCADTAIAERLDGLLDCLPPHLGALLCHDPKSALAIRRGLCGVLDRNELSTTTPRPRARSLHDTLWIGPHRLTTLNRATNFGLNMVYFLNFDTGHHLFKTDNFIYRLETTNRYHDDSPNKRMECSARLLQQWCSSHGRSPDRFV